MMTTPFHPGGGGGRGGDGSNPLYGRDPGPLPPAIRQRRQSYHGGLNNGVPYPFPSSNGSFPPGTLPYHGITIGPSYHPAGFGFSPASFGILQPGTAINYQQPTYIYQSYQPSPISPQAVMSSTYPSPVPWVSPSLLSANLLDSTGVVGFEPGHSYFFPPKHTKIHVFLPNPLDIPPWDLPSPNSPAFELVFPLAYHACHVPTKTTVAELMEGLGVNMRDTDEKTRATISEVILSPHPSAGNGAGGMGGKWYKGLTVEGGDKKLLKMTIGEIGWDETRTGLEGGKGVVWVWLSKGS